MRNRLLNAKSMTIVGTTYKIVPLDVVMPSDGAALQCPKCGKKKCSAYQGNVQQSGIFEDITIDFWHCKRCGWDFGARVVRTRSVTDVD